MKTITQKIHQWGLDRKIIQHGDFETQRLKLWSEFGEMCDSLAKGNCPKDDIGDQFVVLVMMAGIDGKENLMQRTAGTAIQDIMISKRSEHDHVRDIALHYRSSRHSIFLSLFGLAAIAQRHNLTLKECAEHAYNEIKDRKGFLNEQGVFVKEDQ